MQTTQLFAELIIIGIEVSIWLSFLIASIHDVNLESLFKELYNQNVFKVLISIVIIAICYVLGILFDEFWEQSPYKIADWIKKIKKRDHPKCKQFLKKIAIVIWFKNEKYQEEWHKEAYVFAHSPSGTMQLNYMRGRLRIVRSSVFNFGLITLFSLVYLWRVSKNNSKVIISITIFLFGYFIVRLSYFVFQSLTKHYWERVEGIHKALIEDKK